jgi:hypothetical protein
MGEMEKIWKKFEAAKILSTKEMAKIQIKKSRAIKAWRSPSPPI